MTPAIGSTALIFVVEAAVRALVFAGVVALALKLFRVSSAAVRLSVWTLVLVAALAMPIITPALPAFTWNVPAPIERLVRSAATLGSGHQPTTQTLLTMVVRPAAASTMTATWTFMALGVYVAGVVALLTRGIAGWRLALRFDREARVLDDDRVLARMRHLAA